MIKKDNILRATDKGIHVFRHYLGKDFKVGKNFPNPFYRDTKASCNIYYDRKAGVFKMKDFGNEEYSGDCFELVGRLNGLDCRNPKGFVEIMRIIDRDPYLGLSKNDNLEENRPMGTHSENDASANVPVERRKRPYATVQKPFPVRGDMGENYCFGLEQLPAKGDLLFITGGEKDVMSLAAHGLNAICFNSETAMIPQTLIHRLSFRFKHIVLLFDTDKTGLESSLKREEELRQYGVKRLVLPLSGQKEEKDISDYFALGNSREDLIRLFLEYLDTLYNEAMSALKSCELDFNNPPPVAQMIVSVNGVPLGTQGNLLCITGKGKDEVLHLPISKSMFMAYPYPV